MVLPPEKAGGFSRPPPVKPSSASFKIFSPAHFFGPGRKKLLHIV
jgi:hypothetical protein